MYNLADVNGTVMRVALENANRIFRDAGITLYWTAGDGSNPEARFLDFSMTKACDASGHRSKLVVRLLKKTPRYVPVGELGFALPCSRSGVAVTIFMDHCEIVSDSGSATLGNVLGHTLAHEIGHVVLGSLRHTDDGIMRAKWSTDDWQLAAFGRLKFLPDQVRKMRDLIGSAPEDELTANRELSTGASIIYGDQTVDIDAKEPSGSRVGTSSFAPPANRSAVADAANQ